MMKFFYAPHTCAQAAHIVLEHIGCAYEAVQVDFRSNQQRSPEFLAVNPKGRVPALVTERGVLSETPALLLYLAQMHPLAGLAPLDDPFALAELQAVNNWFCSTVHVAHAHRPRGYRWADDESAQQAMKAKVPHNMGECFDWIERELLRGPWVMGKAFTVADPYLYTMSSWLAADGVAIERFPRVVDHFQRMRALPAVQRLLPIYG